MKSAEAEGITGVIEHIALFSESSEERLRSLTALRKKAAECNRLKEFDGLLFDYKVDNYEYLTQNQIDLSYDYCLEDYSTTAPYEEISKYTDPFEKTVQLECAAVKAKKAGFTNFKKAFNNYEKSLRLIKAKSAENINITHPTDFPEQPLELEAGQWNCDAYGVSRTRLDAQEIACLHPIIPVERLVNIDTNEEKLKIAYFKGKQWKKIIVGKNDLFDASKVIKLAAVGISVTTKSAKLLSEYLCDIEALNYDSLPEHKSVSRLGYIGDGQDFSPYVEGLIFDGDANYSTIYKAISQKGSFENG